METQNQDLSYWLERVSQCATRKDVFAVLDQFRKNDWSDQECSQMSRHYIRLVSNMSDDTASDASSGSGEKEKGSDADGPVWYEKM